MVYMCRNNGCIFRTKHFNALKSHANHCIYRDVGEKQDRGEGDNHEATPRTDIRKNKIDSGLNRDLVGSNNLTDSLIFHDYEFQSQPRALSEEEETPLIESREEELETRSTSIAIESAAVNLCLIERKCGKALVNDMIDVISHEDFNKEEFKKKISDIRDCKSICRSILKKNMSAMHFEESVVQTGDRKFSAKIYAKNIVEVLKKQITHADDDSFYFQPVKKLNHSGQPCFGHFMETEFSRKLGEEQRKRIMANDSMDIIWRRKNKDGCDSFVGYIQLYSDKSKTSLKRTAVSAYPVHVCLMNFTKDGWKQTILDDRSVVAYLPVGVDVEEDVWKMSGVESSKTSIPRAVKSELLHRAFELIFKPLSDITQSGFQCVDKVGNKHHCHPILAEVSADCPEQKDLLCLLHGCKTKKPCVRCECINVDLNNGNQYNPRNIEVTREVRNAVAKLGDELGSLNLNVKKVRGVGNIKERIKEVLGAESMLACKSFFESAPFVINNQVCNVYELFGFEAMHVLDLGISKEMKKCVFRRLGSEQIFVNNGKMKGKTLKQLRMAILKACNEMLKRIEMESYVPGCHVDFSSKDGSNALNGLFTNEGICGMLEAKNYREVDYVFPFVAAFIDRVCGDRKGTLTDLCVMYIDLVQECFERSNSTSWDEEKISKVEDHISSFQSICVRHFGNHQPSRFNTEKFHMLAHLGDDVRRFGDMTMLHAGLYENRHMGFKEEYSRTSRRKSTAVSETISRLEFKEILQTVNHNGESDVAENEIELKYGLTRRKNGEIVLLEEFYNYLLDVSSELEDLEDMITKDVTQNIDGNHSTSCIKLLRKIGDQGGLSLLRIISGVKENQEDTELRKSLFRRKIVVVNSGVVEGGHISVKDDIRKSSTLINYIRRGTSRKQRVLASERYGLTGKEAFSYCLLQGLDSEGETIYHVVQVRLLFYIQVDGEWVPKAYIRYMEIVKPKDKVEELLGCVCLRWSTYDEKDYTSGKNSIDENNPPSPWFDIVPFERLISVVQVIRQRYELKESGCNHWTGWRYCLNRFKQVGEPIQSK